MSTPAAPLIANFGPAPKLPSMLNNASPVTGVFNLFKTSAPMTLDFRWNERDFKICIDGPPVNKNEVSLVG